MVFHNKKICIILDIHVIVMKVHRNECINYRWGQFKQLDICDGFDQHNFKASVKYQLPVQPPIMIENVHQNALYDFLNDAFFEYNNHIVTLSICRGWTWDCLQLFIRKRFSMLVTTDCIRMVWYCDQWEVVMLSVTKVGLEFEFQTQSQIF